MWKIDNLAEMYELQRPDRLGWPLTPLGDATTAGFAEITTWHSTLAPNMTRIATSANSAIGSQGSCLIQVLLGPRELSLVVASPFSTSGTRGSLGPDSATFEVDIIEPAERDRTCREIGGRGFMGEEKRSEMLYVLPIPHKYP